MDPEMKIAEGGEHRLRKAIEAQVRREFEKELAAETDHWRKAELEERIAKEVKARLNRVSSPDSLWSAE
jgi:hypothetical protein